MVRRLLARAGIAATIVPPTAVERRLSASATALRRELRHADARLFQQREGAHAKPSVIDLIAMAPLPAPPARRRTLSAATACLAAGVSLIASGEFIQSRQAPLAVSHTASIAAPASIARAKPQPDLARGIIVVREPSARPVRAARPEVRRVSVKRTGSSAAPRRTSAGSRSHSRNLLDRLKLGWLRTRIVIRHDL